MLGSKISPIGINGSFRGFVGEIKPIRVKASQPKILKKLVIQLIKRVYHFCKRRFFPQKKTERNI